MTTEEEELSTGRVLLIGYLKTSLYIGLDQRSTDKYILIL